MTSPPTPTSADSEARTRLIGRASAAVLVLACLARLLAIATEPAYLHPDALYQGLEPAFWLLHDHGLLPWEFRDGLRSWVWPGALAVPMAIGEQAAAWGGGGMATPTFLVRTFVAGIDLIGIYLAMRLARDHAGGIAALATGSMLALHPAFVVMGTNPLIDVPAAVSLLWLCGRALATAEVGRGRGFAIGAAAALTLALRIQTAPAVLAVIAVLLHRARTRRVTWSRAALAAVALGGLGVLLAFGVVDWASWGSPFASTVRYVAFNLREGERFGVMAPDHYARDFLLAFPIVWPGLVLFAALGVRRAPALFFVLLAFALPHQLLGLKVWRFIHPGIVMLVVLAGIGLAVMLEALARHRAGMLRWATLGAVCLLSCELWVAALRQVPWRTTWLHHQGGETAVERSRGLNRAYLELSAAPSPRAIVQAVLPAAGAPGHALLGHDVPVIAPLDGGAWAEAAREADVWVELADLPPPPGSARIWCDEETRVCIDRRASGQN